MVNQLDVQVLLDLSDPHFSSLYTVINFPLSVMSENVKQPPATTITTIEEGCKSEHFYVILMSIVSAFYQTLEHFCCFCYIKNVCFMLVTYEG